MDTIEIQNLFRAFLNDYDIEHSSKVWKKQNTDFRAFWDNVIMKADASLKNDQLIEIIQIFDAQASRGTKDHRVYEEAVCRAIIYQNFWENALKTLKVEKDLRLELDRVFKAQTDDERIKAIDALKKINDRAKGLTGDKAVMLNSMLAGYDVFNNLSMASLEHRYWTMDTFGFFKSDELRLQSYGERNVRSNSIIIEGFRSIIGNQFDARTISQFLYSTLAKNYWYKSKGSETNDAVQIPIKGEEDLDIQEANFALEKHLEDFLIENWGELDFTKPYELLTDDDGAIVSKQYQTDVGFIDILVRHKDTKDFLVIELKKKRTTEAVVGQIRKYLGWISRHLAGPNKVNVKGMIIVPIETDEMKYALLDMKDIQAYTYKVDFSIKNFSDIDALKNK